MDAATAQADRERSEALHELQRVALLLARFQERVARCLKGSLVAGGRPGAAPQL